MNLYDHQFSADLDQPLVAAPEKVLLIASTPRCGSHMLGHAMTRTGLLGIPFEYANPTNLSEWKRRLDIDDSERVLRALMTRRTTPNGIFCLKAHFSHYEMLAKSTSFWDALPDLHVVHIRRADVLRQAISYALARQTGAWISGMTPVSDTAVYDPDLISQCLVEIAQQNALWVSWFAERGLTPLNVFYEDMVDDFDTTLTRVAHLAGAVSGSQVLTAQQATRKQGDQQRTEDWIRRYCADRGRRRSRIDRRLVRKIRTLLHV